MSFYSFASRTDASRPSSLCPPCPRATSLQSVALSSASVLSSQSMKDLSNSTAKHARHPVYPKKRPSPHRDGVAKWRSKQSPIPLAVRRTPQLLRAELMRQRQAQLLAFRKDGIYVEEEYRDEIQFYMHEMEVSSNIRSICYWLYESSLSLFQRAEIYHEFGSVYGYSTGNSMAYAS